MRRSHLLAATLLAFCTAAFAQHDARQIAEDAERHMALSQAMQSLAQCYSVGVRRDECIAQTQPECIGLAVGKYCGLREEGMSDPAKSYALTARAHRTASECMSAGKAYEDCIWDLQTACKGLGVGKYCGMMHVHSF